MESGLKRRSRYILAITILILGVLTSLAVRHDHVRATLLREDPDVILASPDLRAHAIGDGRRVYRQSCASCHGAQGKGNRATGVPDLTDNDFLYGTGKAEEVEQIVLHGIRAGDSKGWNLASMPAYAQAIPYAREKIPPLTPPQMADVIAFLRGANGAPQDPTAVARGHAIFLGSGGCWDCHSNDAAGDNAIGAPDLVDGKWLYGNGSEDDLRQTLTRGRSGVSPAFRGRLNAYDIRAVSVFVASLHPQSATK